jgi:hypothetical protein
MLPSCRGKRPRPQPQHDCLLHTACLRPLCFLCLSWAVCDAQNRCTCWTNSTATQVPACYSPSIYWCPGGNKLVAGAEPTGQCSVPRADLNPAPSPSPRPVVTSPSPVPSTPPPVPPPSTAPGGGLKPSPRKCTAPVRYRGSHQGRCRTGRDLQAHRALINFS